MIDKLLCEIREFCLSNANPAIVQKYSRYFVEGYDAYGLDVPQQEKQRGIWLGRYKEKLGLEGFLQLGDRLVSTGKYEEASLAIWFAAAFRDSFTEDTLTRLGHWLDGGIRNWAHTDFICGEVLSPFLTREIVPLAAFAGWRSAPSKWKRRAVPVTLIKALKAGFAIDDLLAFIAPLINDSEKVVQQGLGWFLREAWKRYPEPVEAFLLQWKDTCGRIVVQYATEKMSAEEKARFKRSKSSPAPSRKKRSSDNQ